MNPLAEKYQIFKILLYFREKRCAEVTAIIVGSGSGLSCRTPFPQAVFLVLMWRSPHNFISSSSEFTYSEHSTESKWSLDV